MNKRISKLTELTLAGKMYAEMTSTQFDREDMFLSKQKRESKRLCEYIMNQEPVLTKYSKFTGFFQCDGTVVGDAFRRWGHKVTQEVMQEFYLKPIDNIITMEWQHAVADYEKVLSRGLIGIIEDIDKSLEVHTEREEIEFLEALKDVANTIIKWAEKCSAKAFKLSEEVEDKDYAMNLKKLSEALKNVPKNKPSSFYEAILTIYVCFSADPDSIGGLDRNLTEFYENDIKNNIITRDEAKEYLQELFLMLQAATPVSSCNFTRGGESHFCIGGYLPNGEDCYNDLSELILEALTELPTWIPQVTLRWTKKTPKEVLRHALDLERNDPNKRIAFQNDEKRIKSYTEICGFPYEQAVRYITTGCNEPAFPGGMIDSSSIANFAHSLETVFHKNPEKVLEAESFEEFYAVFLEAMKKDLDVIYEYDKKFLLKRAEDINYLSSLFFDGCIEKAKSATRGATEIAISSPAFMGITNVIDSLIIVKQFVYDEKYVSMQELVDALNKNWQGYEELRALILKKGDFFGNDTERSNAVGQMLYNSLYEYLKDRRNVFGHPMLVGDLVGYNEHHKWFGEKLSATPDGRCAGDMIKFGLGQSEGKDREGLTALLNSIAAVDQTGIGCGQTVTNLMLDEQLIKNDEYFEKTVDMLETYFINGGVHFQLTYVSKEDLVNAKKTPDEYKNLRVRVSGFSDYFVKLNEGLQDNIIERTSKSK